LGVMLFQMLAGVLPFRGESMAELMYKIANEPAPDIRIIRNEIPDKLADIVELSLSKKPETRYQDGDHFATDLRSVISALSGIEAAPPVTASAPANNMASGAEKTVAFTSGHTADAPQFESTVVQGADPAVSGATFEATQKTFAAEAAPAFEKTIVSNPADHGAQPGNADNDTKP
ncbi:MAG: hypothetical protein V4588_08765, partial [Pseudomonadota bacterium]